MKRILLLVFSYFLLCTGVQAQTADKSLTGSNHSDSSESTQFPSSKKNVIRLYPNPSYGKLSVSATTSSVLHFYIFDLEGTLVYQAVLNNRQKKSIENLQRGTYIYDVFEKDQSIEEGKIIIK